MIIVNNTGSLPPRVFKTIAIVILAVGIYFIIKELYDAYTRDNMVYAQYNWEKIVPGLEHPSTISNKDMFPNLEDEFETCFGQACCETGATYVPPPFNKCVANSQLSSKDVTSKAGIIKPYEPPKKPTDNNAPVPGTNTMSGELSRLI